MDSRLSAGLLGGTANVDTGAYNDLNRLNQFKVGGDSEKNIKKVAQEFESLFLNEMLKAMRSANEVFGEGNFMNSNESKTYQDMHDQQLSVTLSNHQNGLGLADVLVRQMSKMKDASSRPNPFAQVNEPVPSAPSKPMAKLESGRDDVALINQRRLALPGKLTDRLLAGIVPSATAAEGQALAQNDWIPAKSFAAPTDSALALNGADAITGRRIAQPPLAPGKAAFGSKDEFIAAMLPMAEKAADKIGVDPRYLVAQAALETGWGKSIIRQQDGSSSHNLFGIKTHDSWDGESARVLTTEFQGGKAVKEAASFRAYESYAHSFEDYVSFLQGNGRYEKALAVTDKPEQFARELQKAGYATDPQYARKIAQIARQMQTYQTVAAVSTPSISG
ncbi:flagellar assembly peptidoglycan hydrolase FlgJ [Pseudomonas sp. HMWF032]|uniref:flagellar assembly peptidoglycan hydrolase FlgJ n=1 Tax=unclassified Pseudomonas TaxID=196821 RepID=UPI000D34A012|nr:MULTISPECIES: flagellar assembly peptidoglycan hydrolase FlgJ [unclassified Pseudomonas]PTS83641.1 flagellar assembly peptidoglycan hydrolase FlgJ [Pseudomonas sp. HMWF032]PTT83999.1 flagellar assembly peptidoglycan hydrolase FlgJ [Pseudomonas sp. HMWF010]WAC44876.1 flagellar assembly peptidoglycan hydrolase FlgJ [Pseudomonas sp. SL4(2022)]